jgi:hypothetical protein
MLTSTVINAALESDLYVHVYPEMKEFEGPYLWQGHQYEKFMRIDMGQGYVDEYSNRDQWCHSFLIN